VGRRRPRTSWHAVEAQRRALETMGKLAATHANADRGFRVDANRRTVRVVSVDDATDEPSGRASRRACPQAPSVPTQPVSENTTGTEQPLDDLSAGSSRPGLLSITPGPNVRLVHGPDATFKAPSESPTTALARAKQAHPVIPATPTPAQRDARLDAPFDPPASLAQPAAGLS
jgi:hypothetical protein